MLTLSIVTPTGSYGPFECDSVHLNICDDTEDKKGGSYGIRKGHTKSVLSLACGTVTALLSGKTVFFAKSGDGFAFVDKNTVNVSVETIEIIES